MLDKSQTGASGSKLPGLFAHCNSYVKQITRFLLPVYATFERYAIGFTYG